MEDSLRKKKINLLARAATFPELLNCYLSCPAHLSKEIHVRNESMRHLRVFDIGNAKLFTGLLDNPADLRIMHMGNFREKVVFDLKIQSANKPADDLIARCEVCRGL